jgi:hypothetical protein
MSLSRSSSLIGSPSDHFTLSLQPSEHYTCDSTILDDPQPIPRDTDYASVFESDVPIVVQHTRLDSRRAEIDL